MANAERKEQILTAAIKRAETDGYNRITRDSVAAEAQCSPALVSNYFNTMQQLRRAIMRAAIKCGNVIIVRQGLALNDAQAKKAPHELKAAAVASLAN